MEPTLAKVREIIIGILTIVTFLVAGFMAVPLVMMLFGILFYPEGTVTFLQGNIESVRNNGLIGLAATGLFLILYGWGHPVRRQRNLMVTGGILLILGRMLTYLAYQRFHN